MRPTQFIRRSRRKGSAGFTLIETLVTLLITGVIMTMITGFFRANAKVQNNMSARTEAQQGVRALLEIVTQELRQAGACLPENGEFIALDATNGGGTPDALTIRIGQTDPETLVCIRAGTTEAASDGSTDLTFVVGDGDLFENVTLVYITPNGANGEFYTVASNTSTTISLNEPLDGDHPIGAGVYAVDERVYSVIGDTLTLSIDNSTPYPLVDGVLEFEIEYYSAPCDTLCGLPSCCVGPTPLVPATDSDWREVRELTIATKVKSQTKNKDGSYPEEEGEVNVKPRNLI